MSLEERVVALVVAGEPGQAATSVITELGPTVFDYLRAVLRDEDDAAEAFSIFAESTWEAIPGFRRSGSLRAWTLAVAWNAVRRLRGEAWRRRRRPLLTSEAAQLARSVLVSSVALRERRADALEELRRDLDEEEQHLLVLRIDQRLPWQEVASVLSADGARVSPALVRKRFERLKEKLARLARARGLLDDDPGLA